jgi:hypothetical protein
MKCMVCGKPLREYALMGKKKEIKVAFCIEHLPDCKKCDSCDLRCIRCGKDVKMK